MKRLKIIFLIIIFCLFILLISCYNFPAGPVDNGNFLPYEIEPGKTWEIFDTPLKYNSYIEMIDSFMSKDGSKFYALDKNYLYISSDGNNWQTTKIEKPTRICFSSDGKVFFAFGTINSNYSYSLLKSIDYGNTFESLADVSDLDDRNFLISCSDDGSILLYSMDNKLSIYKNSKFYKITAIDDNLIYSMVAVSPDASILLAGKKDGPIYISHDQGNNWEKINSLPDKHWKKAVFSSDSSKIFIITGDNKIIYSIDSGNNWQNISNCPFNNPKDFDISDSGQYIYIAEEEGYIYKSSNGGLTFEPLTILGTKKLTSISCSYDGSKVVAGIKDGSKKILYSENYLNSIIYFNIPISNLDLSYTKIIYDFGAISEDGNSAILLDNANNIIITEDSGHTWQDRSKADFNKIVNFSASADLNVMAVINDNSLYISKDRALTWNKVQSVSFSYEYYGPGLSVSKDGSTIVAVGYNLVCYSKDSGASWHIIDSVKDTFFCCFISNSANIIIIISKNNLYLLKNNSLIRKITNTYFSSPECSMTEDGSKIIINDGNIFFTKDYGDTWSVKNDEFGCVAISSDGSIIMAVEYYCLYGFLSVETGGYIHRFPGDFYNGKILKEYSYVLVRNIVFSNDNSLIFMFNKHNIYASTDKGFKWAHTYLPAEIAPDEIANDGKIIEIKLLNENKKLILLSSSCLAISQTY